jgi:hypothetical protein
MSSKQMPWEAYPHIWKTESAFMSWLRGGIRGGLWNKHPVKLEFIKKNRIQIPNPNPKGKKPTVWGAVCSLTGEIVPINQIQVDHKVGNHSLRSLDDIQSFIESIVLVTDEDLQLVSKDAHTVKSYAERKGITFEEAIIEKKVIAFGKLPVEEQKSFLTAMYGNDRITFLSNKSKRLEAYRNHLKEKANE